MAEKLCDIWLGGEYGDLRLKEAEFHAVPGGWGSVLPVKDRVR